MIEGVLTPEECQQYQQGVWRWLGGLGDQISREEPSSWDEARGWPPSFKGIINTMEVAHQEFVWRVRKHPRVVEVWWLAGACLQCVYWLQQSWFLSVLPTAGLNECAGVPACATTAMYSLFTMLLLPVLSLASDCAECIQQWGCAGELPSAVVACLLVAAACVVYFACHP